MTTATSTNSRVKPGINVMIIYGKLRTGSTFTSEFFFQHEDIAFMFEPFRVRRDEEPVSDGQQILWDMFNCQFRTSSVQRIVNTWLDRYVFCYIENQFPGCISGAKYPIEKAEKHCNQTHTHVIKVVRIAKLSELETFFKQGVKILHLIRDPRGVVNSRVRVQGHTHDNVTHDAATYCNTAVDDMKYIREQERNDPTFIRQIYHIVRYEDLAADPVKGMTSLYEFMGISPDENVRKWAKSQATPATETDGQEEKVYNTWRRNPEATSAKWRNSTKYSSVLQIQKVCEEFFSMFGYQAVNSEDELHNNLIPVVNPIDTENLLYTHWKQHWNPLCALKTTLKSWVMMPTMSPLTSADRRLPLWKNHRCRYWQQRYHRCISSGCSLMFDERLYWCLSVTFYLRITPSLTFLVIKCSVFKKRNHIKYIFCVDKGSECIDLLFWRTLIEVENVKTTSM